MKIERIELYYVKIPLSGDRPGFFDDRVVFEPNWIPGYHQIDLRLYLLRLVTDAGIDGVAAIPAMGRERESLGALLGAYLLGLNPLDMRLVNQRIEEFSILGMRNGWIDAAFWDLVGKIRREPLWKVLGGEGGFAVPYASLGSNHDHDPRAVAELVTERRNEGFAGVKIRVKSDDLARMVDVVAAARDAAGDSMELMVDANLGWPVELVEKSPRWDEEFAERFAEAIAPYRPSWLEEPLHRADHEALARLRARSKVPIAGGEVTPSWREFRSMLDAESLDVYQPDAVLAGGTYAGGVSVVRWLVREIRRRNAARGPETRPLRYTPHTFTNGLGFAVNLHLFGLLPQKERGLFELPHDRYWQMPQWARFIRNGILRDAEGRLRIPDEPGLGVEIDWEVIARFGKRIDVITKASLAAWTVLDHGWREAVYLRNKKREVEDRSALAEFELPEPPF
ncbi:enolase C-terminal domain-like protein [Polyangium sp. 6x1]|uniref:mandelate racemase/muconate lactonizing enzyme family protein n=1 Tax=Polyangium sp. 6x1 TaxID=3042689 RepID=UPI0024827441|nr:enolase C-terminal domain-like protein [Polyangium sp. 6x1]MDI1445350.1 enolase C-terminal domain-like protein [Polyangium sp. 6x1]